MSYLAYVLSEQDRSKLLTNACFGIGEIVAHHVTAVFPVPSDMESPMTEHDIVVIGHAFNDKVSAVVVEIDGSSVRKDGKILHITISVNRKNGGKPLMSNDLIADGFTRFYEPFTIKGRLQVVH